MTNSNQASKNVEKFEEGLYAYGVLYQSDRFLAWEKSKGETYAKYRVDWNLRVTERNCGEIPLNLNVEVTTRCNLACTFCSHPSLTKEQTGDLPLELYKKVLSEAKQHGGIKAVNLNGLGEPTLRKDLPEFIRIAQDYGSQDTMFHTNGTQLKSEKYVEDLIEAGIDRIIVSVDSPDKETYESMRLVKGSWDANLNKYRNSTKGSPHQLLIENVQKLIKLVKEKGHTRPIIRVTCVLTEKTFPQMNQFKNFWIKQGADLITYQDLTWHEKNVPVGSADNSWTTSERSHIEDEYKKLNELPLEDKKKFVCPPLYQSAWIEFDGQVVPCSHPDARRHMVMGNIQDKSLQEIWRGEEYSSLRETHEKGEWDSHPICGRCEVPLIEIRKRQKNMPVVPIEIVEKF